MTSEVVGTVEGTVVGIVVGSVVVGAVVVGRVVVVLSSVGCEGGSLWKILSITLQPLNEKTSRIVIISKLIRFIVLYVILSSLFR